MEHTPVNQRPGKTDPSLSLNCFQKDLQTEVFPHSLFLRQKHLQNYLRWSPLVMLSLPIYIPFKDTVRKSPGGLVELYWSLKTSCSRW